MSAGSMSNNWTSLKKNLRKKSSSAWNLKVKNPPHHKGSSITNDPAHQLASALANISHGTGSSDIDCPTDRRFYCSSGGHVSVFTIRPTGSNKRSDFDAIGILPSEYDNSSN